MSYSTGSSANRRSLSGPAAADRAGRVERRAPAALYGLFFLSGAAALAYEVLWMRGFAIFLGAAAPAAAAALAASFAGFGFGSYLLGRFAPRLRRPLRAFAILEISTGVSALAVDSLLRTAPPVLTWLSDAPGNSAALQLAVKVALAIASVLIPATAMGGTLPVLAQFVAPRGESLGVRSGGLYAVNMFGACAGALAVPAVLLPAIGATGALGAAITINFLVATAALLLDRSNEPANLEPSPPVQGNRPSRETLILAAVSGGITLALEALASRAVALIHENSVYSFATVVAVLLAGLASGAAAARRALRRRVAPRALASIGWAGAGVWMVLLPALFVRITGLDYVTSARLLAHEAHLAPTAGLWTAVSLLGACSIIAAAFAARGAAGTIRSTVGAAVVIAIVAFFVTEPASLPAVKLSGRDQLLHLSEGAFGSVAVVEHDGHRRIKLNNFYVRSPAPRRHRSRPNRSSGASAARRYGRHRCSRSRGIMPPRIGWRSVR